MYIGTFCYDYISFIDIFSVLLHPFLINTILDEFIFKIF